MIEPPQVIVPMLGQENAVTLVIEVSKVRISHSATETMYHCLSSIQLTAERLQEFRVVTARAITTYCATAECVLVTIDGEERSVILIERS